MRDVGTRGVPSAFRRPILVPFGKCAAHPLAVVTAAAKNTFDKLTIFGGARTIPVTQSVSVVRTRKEQVSLSANLSCGAVVRTLQNDLFDEPSTAVRKGNSLYAVMFKYQTPAEEVETPAYEIVRVDRDGDAKDVCLGSS